MIFFFLLNPVDGGTGVDVTVPSVSVTVLVFAAARFNGDLRGEINVDNLTRRGGEVITVELRNDDDVNPIHGDCILIGANGIVELDNADDDEDDAGIIIPTLDGAVTADANMFVVTFIFSSFVAPTYPHTALLIHRPCFCMSCMSTPDRLASVTPPRLILCDP